MNIHPTPTQACLAPPEWTMQLCSERTGDTCQHICIVLRKHVEMCGLSIASSSGEPEEVRLEAAQKARVWIADYLERTGTPAPRAQVAGELL
ncbi:MAG: hypothetical protein JSS14_21235 [Proteobacteria bacterium]|nr:hypothetical protein [Pseudomonadota bacterium]